ncbi:MAG: AIR synthase family protein [Dehalococcoidales bacterium]
MNTLPVGKLPNTLLKKFIEKIRINDERVVLGPAIGEDVAVINFNNKLLVAKTDPVTFATDLIGWYAVNVNANDIATLGVRPRWFLATILLSEQGTEQEAENIFDQILSACNSLGITLVGGHTEITYGFTRPVVIGCMLAEAENQPIITTSGAKPGDDIVISKGIAIEGTAVLAREAKQTLLSSMLSKDLVQRAADYLFTPGISVLQEALIACSKVEVHSMHDPTEGGLATGLWEIANAAQVGILVEENKIPILPECQAICERFALNPLGLLASGALIITLAPAETVTLLSALTEAGIDAEIIGRVVRVEEGLKMHTARGTQELPQFERDELARFLET